MSYNWNNHGLPFLPGYSFRDGKKSSHHRPQTLSYKNGIAVPRRPSVGIGQEPLLSDQLSQQRLSELPFDISKLLYSPDDKKTYKDFIPAHVALDKKVLRFYAYFLEDALNSPEEDYRVRHVVIHYILEDDTMYVTEPKVKNSGLSQGKQLKRHRLPKSERGDFYHWTDLNVGIDLKVYGITYHITHCDDFTKEFMRSQGIILNDPEPVPEDPYTKRRQIPEPTPTIPSACAATAFKQFLTMDGKVLRFNALWDNSDSYYEEKWPVVICYHLADDTVKIIEVHKKNSGQMQFPIFLNRCKIPKKIKSGPLPSCFMEMSNEDVEEYFSPKDFQLGHTINLMSHRFLLYDCDDFTKKYYKETYPDMEMNPIEVLKKDDPLPERHIPPYNGFGSLEDSLRNCLSLIPKPPKGTLCKVSEDKRVLRYSARLESSYPEDEERRFVLSYFLSDGMISIFENTTRNSGFIGGKILQKTRVPKPGSTVDNPEYYSPADFAIGATVDVFGRRFVLTDASLSVLNYLESVSNEIPSHTMDSLRQKLCVEMDGKQPADQEGEEPQSAQ